MRDKEEEERRGERGAKPRDLVRMGAGSPQVPSGGDGRAAPGQPSPAKS